MSTQSPTLSTKDPQLLNKVLALYPAPQLPDLSQTIKVSNPKEGGELTPEMSQFVDSNGPGSAIFNQNFNQAVEYEMRVPNSQAYDDFNNRLHQWWSSLNTDHSQFFPNPPRYKVLDPAQYVQWWSLLLSNITQNFMGAGIPDVNPPHFYLVDAPTPVVPTISDSPAVPAASASSPVGNYIGSGLWAATDMARLFPDGEPWPAPDQNSPTGWLKLVSYVSPFTLAVGVQYWEVGPAPASATTAASLQAALQNVLNTAPKSAPDAVKSALTTT